ncbi:MAG: efflux RND transporter permease subunit, partial [Bradymonadaceae bacterium]
DDRLAESFHAEAIAELLRVTRDEVRIFVRRPEDERVSEWNIENMIVRTPDGGELPLRQAAFVERNHSSTTIQRQGGRRVVEVSADVASENTTGSELTSTLESTVIPKLTRKFPGLDYRLGGQQRQRQEGLAALARGFGFALLVIFSLIAVASRSYVQPLTIMCAIPFGLIGAIYGHILMGFNISLVSLMGFVALAGVVINDSLVYIAAVNDYRDEGLSPIPAVRRAGVRRFRAIVLTSLTTFFGLAPMIFETSVQAKFLVPMALSLGFGVLFVTPIALLIVPALYMAIIDAKRLLGLVPPAEDDPPPSDSGR